MTCNWLKTWHKEVDETVTHEKKTSEALLDDERETDRALQREVRKLTEALSQLEDNRQKGKKKKFKRCLLARCYRGEGCPANTRRCNRCGELGHFSRSSLCKGVSKVQDEDPSKQEMMAGAIREGERDSQAGRQFRGSEDQFIGRL